METLGRTCTAQTHATTWPTRPSRTRMENVGKVCTMQTYAATWPTRPSPNKSGECGEGLHDADLCRHLAQRPSPNKSGECGEGLHDADLCRHLAHEAISKQERRMWGRSARRRPMPPLGPRGHLQTRVENVGKVCTTQTYAATWPTRPSPNKSGECGEGLHDADLCRHLAHEAISKQERRTWGRSAQRRPMPPPGPQGRLRTRAENAGKVCIMQTYATARPTRPSPKRVENAGRVCTTQTHAAAWPTRPSPVQYI
jgi:hypothetical protein